MILSEGKEGKEKGNKKKGGRRKQKERKMEIEETELTNEGIGINSDKNKELEKQRIKKIGKEGGNERRKGGKLY